MTPLMKARTESIAPPSVALARTLIVPWIDVPTQYAESMELTTEGGVGNGGSDGVTGGRDTGDGNGATSFGAVEPELCRADADVDPVVGAETAGMGATLTGVAIGAADGDGLGAIRMANGASLRNEPLAASAV
jgi:hypothetical protein